MMMLTFIVTVPISTNLLGSIDCRKSAILLRVLIEQVTRLELQSPKLVVDRALRTGTRRGPRHARHERVNRILLQKSFNVWNFGTFRKMIEVLG